MGEERLGLLDIAHEEDRETIRSAIATALKEHRRWELVYRIITAWGEEMGVGAVLGRVRRLGHAHHH